MTVQFTDSKSNVVAMRSSPHFGPNAISVTAPAVTEPHDWVEQVASYVRVVAATLPGISGAFVSKDGCRVTLTGSEWTEDLSAAGAKLVVALRRELKASESRWIEGGFSPSHHELPDDCFWVYGP